MDVLCLNSQLDDRRHQKHTGRDERCTFCASGSCSVLHAILRLIWIRSSTSPSRKRKWRPRKFAAVMLDKCFNGLLVWAD